MEIFESAQIIPHVANTYTTLQINSAMQKVPLAYGVVDKFYTIHCSWEGLQQKVVTP